MIAAQNLKSTTKMISRGSASTLSGSGRKSGVSLALNGHSAHHAGTAITSVRERLAARSRVTNLGILLLAGVATLSVLLNMRVYLFGRRYIPPPGFGSWTTFHGLTPTSLKNELPNPIKGTAPGEACEGT